MPKNHNTFTNIFEKITTYENFKKAYDRTQKTNTKYKNESIKFSFDLIYNLEKLREKVKSGNYKPKAYNIFKVHEPKERVIAAPKFEDKIVQFAVHNVINDDFEKKFIYDSYACIKGKGTHAAADRIQHFLRKSKWMWNAPWIIKADIRKFFYSIKHKILKQLLAKNIKCLRTSKLLYKIIDNSPEPIGLPLGNVTSQLFANLYLNELDQYCKRKLSLKFYVRYMDDMAIIVKTREKAKEIKSKISQFVIDSLNLKMNQKKTKIFPLAQGINMVGYKIWPTHKLLRNSTKKKIKQKLSKFKRLIGENKISISKVEQILNSWKGHADHASSDNFYQYLEGRFDYIFRDENDTFKIKL